MQRAMRAALIGVLFGIIGGMAFVQITRFSGMGKTEEEAAVLSLSARATTDDKRQEAEDRDYESDVAEAMGQTVNDAVLRFHVRANSETEADQELKMQVKEYALAILQPVMEEADSMESAKRMLSAKLPYVKNRVEDYMKKNGYDYDAEVYFTTEYFPLKKYGNATFPAGKYDALRIDIGNADGQNWWCVMYPGLCFIDATHSELPLASQEKLKAVLSEKEYQALMEEPEKPHVFLRSGIAADIRKGLQSLGEFLP